MSKVKRIMETVTKEIDRWQELIGEMEADSQELKDEEELFKTVVTDGVQEVMYDAMDLVSDAKTAISEIDSTTVSSTAAPSWTAVTAKLPKLELPLFDGTPALYCEFFDIFNSVVHSQANLNNT